MANKSKPHVTILGAGLAGLACGYELTKAGYQVTLIEKESSVGGLAKTIKEKGFRFDTGPHRWYTKNDMVNNWMLKLLGDEVIKIPRLTRIYFDGKFFNYPVKIKSTLEGMGIWKTTLAVFDYFRSRLSQRLIRRPVVTIEEGYIAQFGRVLYEMFFKRYTEKLWGTSCKNISADWLGQRSRGFNITTIIKSVFQRQNKVVSFVDEFSYPRLGIGRLAEKLAESISKSGGKILLNSYVDSLNCHQNNIQRVNIKQKNKIINIKTEEVVSTIPLSELISGLRPKVSETILASNRKLTYRDEVQVVLFINKTKITPDTWVYVHPIEIPFVRFMEMDNWSKSLSPPGTTAIVFEIVCNIVDSIWNMTDQQLTKLVSDAFIKEFKLVKNSDIIGSYVHRITGEYPVYHIGYKNDLNKLKSFLSQYSNLQIAGRNGTFRYNNMDHSVEMGLYAAWNIIEGERKFDIESINIEREYLEEKKIPQDPELAEDQYVENAK